jgi:hypothetical protein
VSPSRAKSRSSAGARRANSKAVLAPADKLKRDVQGALTDELDAGQGFAYVAAEAYFHLAGGYEAGLHPVQLKYRGKSHWWLVDRDGRVIDLTLGPVENSKFPYRRGARRPFRYTPAGISRRGQAVVDRVKAARG